MYLYWLDFVSSFSAENLLSTCKGWNGWKMAKNWQNMICYAKTEDILNRKPLGVTCSNLQEFSLLMMSIGGASLKQSFEFQNPKYLDISVWNDSYMYLCVCTCVCVCVTTVYGYVYIWIHICMCSNFIDISISIEKIK